MTRFSFCRPEEALRRGDLLNHRDLTCAFSFFLCHREELWRRGDPALSSRAKRGDLHSKFFFLFLIFFL